MIGSFNERIILEAKWAVGLFSLLLMTIGGCGPIWLLDLSYAQRQAKQERKPLLVYFKAWDSTQHRNMKTKVLEDPAIKKELLDTINLEVEYAWAPDEAKRWNVQRPQVCVMCTPDGERAAPSLNVNPVPTEKDFLDWLQQVKPAAKPGGAVGPPPPASQPARPSPPEP